jgi:hypothetical protein
MGDPVINREALRGGAGREQIVHVDRVAAMTPALGDTWDGGHQPGQDTVR